MRRIVAVVVFICALFSALPLAGAMASDTFLYYDAITQIKGESPSENPVFCEGVWSLEWLDSTGETFSLMGSLQQTEEGPVYAAPEEPACRITEGVLCYTGASLCPCIAFTAPADGTVQYSLFGYFREGTEQDSLRLYLGNEPVTLWRNDPAGTSLFANCSVEVHAGDKIRLVVQSVSGAPFCISSAPTVTYQRQDEPEESVPVDPSPEVLIPTGLRLTELKEDRVYIQWDAPAEDLYYNVYVNGEKLYAGLHFSQGGTSPVPIPCQPGTAYTFTVSVVGEYDSEFPPSEALKILLPPVPASDENAPSDGVMSSGFVSSAMPEEENLLLYPAWILASCAGVLTLAVIVLLVLKIRKRS